MIKDCRQPDGSGRPEAQRLCGVVQPAEIVDSKAAPWIRAFPWPTGSLESSHPVSTTLSPECQQHSNCRSDTTSENVSAASARLRENDRLLTAEELADFLDVPIKTLYAWRYRGEGPVGFRVGRHIRYRWIDVEEWIEDRIAYTCHSRVAQSP